MTCRFVNDNHINPNSNMKKIEIDGEPHLCLFATRDISKGDEIDYNYGKTRGGDHYWRKVRKWHGLGCLMSPPYIMKYINDTDRSKNHF